MTFEREIKGEVYKEYDCLRQGERKRNLKGSFWEIEGNRGRDERNERGIFGWGCNCYVS